MFIYQPYTYLIGWSSLDKWYYGVRYSKKCHPNDLWKSYFTSSKHVKTFRQKYGEPDVVEVRKVFSNKESAFLWEQKVLKRLNVPFNKKWINANIGGSFNMTRQNNFYTNNPMKNEKSRKKLSDTRKEKNLGKKSAKWLKPLYGDMNPMRNPSIVSAYSKKITGRKKKYREDGSWYWHYPEKNGGDFSPP